jgi:hypothetical protein
MSLKVSDQSFAYFMVSMHVSMHVSDIMVISVNFVPKANEKVG